VERTNRDLTRFLQAIRYEDLSQTYSNSGIGSSYSDLKTAFTEVLDAFRRARAEKEEHYRYLQTVVQHVGIGLICFRPDGGVTLMNTAAERILRSGQLRNLADLRDFSETLVDTLARLGPGEKALVKVEDRDELLQLMVYATELRIQDQRFTLVSIQNIQSELEEKETEAWQNLIRVLTHEIMNSITPIASLATTVNGLLSGETDGNRAADTFPNETLQDVRDAVRTIQKRSEGLLHFVDTYRQLTRIPKPVFKIIRIEDLFSWLQQLMRVEMTAKSIEFRFSVQPTSLELTADPDLIEHALINLLTNAIQALNGWPDARIELSARLDARGRVLVQVKDNGPGILEEVQERIFIPFFTTKQDGSGIGLSLCRQIMRLHNGTIGVQSNPGEETVFTLRF
jgi:signal transduction histidine kinase